MPKRGEFASHMGFLLPKDRKVAFYDTPYFFKTFSVSICRKMS